MQFTIFLGSSWWLLVCLGESLVALWGSLGPLHTHPFLGCRRRCRRRFRRRRRRPRPRPCPRPCPRLRPRRPRRPRRFVVWVSRWGH